MKIWVDADACPAAIKSILFKAAERIPVQVVVVANRQIRIPRTTYINFIKVPAGLNEADNEILKRLDGGDLVITADIPLAAEVIAKEALALNPRGELYSHDTIKSRLSMRDFMDNLRASGIDTGGPAALSKSDLNCFANHLDRLLTKHCP